ncbi:MAG: alpha/beta hydrolase [Gammaproteobacteria bacterium]
MTSSLLYRLFFLALTIVMFGCSAPVALQRHTVEVDGHPIALWEKSARRADRAVLLVHGRTWSALPDFDLQVQGEDLSLMDGLVARGYAVYAIDLRGYGQTPRDASQWLTPNRAADDVAAVLNWITAERGDGQHPHLFGWSMGSTVSQLAAQRHPGVAASLTLFGYWRDDDQALPADTQATTLERRVNTAEAAASDFIVPGSISQAAIDAYVAAALAADPVRVDVRSVDHYNALDPAALDLPTLVIFGEHDPIAPLERQVKLFERLGSGHKQLISVAGGDHAAYLETPRPQFLEALDAFFKSVALAR